MGIDRRTMMGGVAAAGTAVSGLLGQKQAFARTTTIPADYDFEPRGTKGRLERLPRLDTESRDDFLAGYRSWGTYTALAEDRRRFRQLMEEAGIDPDAEGTPLERVFEIIEGDPIIGAAARYRTDVQDVMYRNLHMELMANADAYLEELEAYEKVGPGSVSLNADLPIPDYMRYEIHCQPGGFVGHPLGGHLYFYGTNSLFEGRREAGGQDELHTRLARQTPVPEDGQVRRVLDLGTSVGQLATAYKERFTSSDVWGVDISAPYLRFAHMRAVDLGLEVHFAHQNAERLDFPDNHFDVVGAFILHHEIPAEASVNIIRELHRVIRPGGLYFPIDFYTGYEPKRLTPQYMFSMWKDHRWNQEVWREEYRKLNFNQALRDAGFDVNENGPPARVFKSNLVATKRA